MVSLIIFYYLLLIASSNGNNQAIQTNDRDKEPVTRYNLRAYFHNYMKDNMSYSISESGERKLDQEDLSEVGPYVFLVRMIGLTCIFPFWATWIIIIGIGPLVSFFIDNLFYFYSIDSIDGTTPTNETDGSDNTDTTNITKLIESHDNIFVH